METPLNREEKVKSEELINSPNLSNLLAQMRKNQARLKRFIIELWCLFETGVCFASLVHLENGR